MAEEQETEHYELSDEAKLFLIDQDIRHLHQQYLNQGLSPKEIEKKAKPLLDIEQRRSRKKWFRRFWMIAILVALAAWICQVEYIKTNIWVTTRVAFVKILPFWDWRYLHELECVIPNPYYLQEELTEEHCKLCEILEGVERISNVSHELLTEKYLKQDMPVIITDAVKQWAAQDKFTPAFLNELYAQEEDLKMSAPCVFSSSMKDPNIHLQQFLQKVVDGLVENYYAFWVNCDLKAAKVMRNFYKRPYFIPPMVELDTGNWIFISANYLARTYKPVDMPMSMIWYAQLKGKSKLMLSPRDPCDHVCSKLYVTLHPGETLILTEFLWMLDYKPMGDVASLALAGGGHFD